MLRTMDTNEYQRMQCAIEYLIEQRKVSPSLSAMAAHVGMSEFHFQRVFSRWAGISPKRFQQFLARNESLAAIQLSNNVLNAADNAGLSSASRLYDVLVHCDAITPGQALRYGEGVMVEFGSGNTPLGQAQVAWTQYGVTALHFSDDPNTLNALRHSWPRAQWLYKPLKAQTLLEKVFLNGQCHPMHLRGTNFQIKVWQALLSIPYGTTVTYGDIAQSIGQPSAIRAVSTAIAKNDIAVLIPCHRVIRESGILAGYRWGLERKAVLLAAEH